MTVAYDTETALIRPGRAAPELACVSFAYPTGEQGILHWQDPILPRELKDLLCNDLIVGHNVAFDMCVLASHLPSLLPLIFDAYDDNRVTDTLIRQQLIDIADGTFRGRMVNGTWMKTRYDLDSLCRRYGYEGLDKDTYRLTYGQLRDLPLNQWPQGAIDYSIKDSVTTLGIFQRQGGYIADEYEQARAFFALQLASVWGLRTDPVAIKAFEQTTVEHLAELKSLLMEEGLVRADGSRDTKKAMARIHQAWKELQAENPLIEPRLTETGEKKKKAGTLQEGECLSLDEDACTDCEDPLMKSYADYSTTTKILSTDIPLLLTGATLPLHTRYKMLETTRIGSSRAEGLPGGNTQNIRRKPGIRECFIPRLGWVYANCDYPALELRTLAEVCYEWLGYSTLGDALNKGIDPHTAVGAIILNTTVDELQPRVDREEDDATDARGGGKVGNFGLPGGLGAKTFVQYARTAYGVIIDIDKAQLIKRSWSQAWPEMRDYHALIKSMQGPDGLYRINHIGSGIQSACPTFCQAANRPFQLLGASCAKRGLYYVTRACFDPDSILYGAHVVNFVHDEIIVEMPYEKWGPQRTHDAAYEMARLFTEGAQEQLRHVKISCKPKLMKQWSKKAVQKFDKEGLLTPWDYKLDLL